jgi:hypothetical protein
MRPPGPMVTSASGSRYKAIAAATAAAWEGHNTRSSTRRRLRRSSYAAGAGRATWIISSSGVQRVEQAVIQVHDSPSPDRRRRARDTGQRETVDLVEDRLISRLALLPCAPARRCWPSGSYPRYR